MAVREVIWDRPHDMRRFADPLQGIREGFRAPPTISVRDGKIARELVVSWLEEVRQTPVALLGVTGAWGLDGEVWGIEVNKPFLEVRLQWWGAGPTEWAPFTQAVAHLHDLLTGGIGEDKPSI